MENFNLKKLESYGGNILESPREKFSLSPIFELSRNLHYTYKPKPKSLTIQKLFLLTESSIWCLQMSSFLWIPNLTIRNWKENSDFWRIIGYMRLDNACSAYGIINLCIYTSLLITLISIIAIFLMAIMILYSKPIPSLISKIVKQILYFFSVVFKIPVFTLFTICLKYNWFPKTYVYEYYENNEISNFEVNILVQILIIAGLAGYFFIYVVIGVICSGEIRHSMANHIIDAKAHSKIDIYLAFSDILIPILFTTIGSYNIVFFQVILIIVFGALTVEILEKLPYFNFFTNCLTSIKCLQIPLISSFFIFAKIIDASFITLLLFIIILPIIDAIIIYKIKYSKKKNIPKTLIYFGKIQNIFGLERCLRDFFCSNSQEKREEILSLLGKCFNETMLYKNKLLIIWEVNYCVFTLGDKALAKIKLCKSRFSDHSIEGDYQEYICKKVVSEFNSSESEKFLVYFQKINKTKKEDADLCVRLLDFWKEVVSKKPNLNKLNKMMDLVSNSAISITESYSHLHEKFPKSKEALTFYYTFVKYILCDIDKSTHLSYKIQSIHDVSELSSQSKDTNFFDDNNGVMLVYCENKNFGEIAFANQKSAEILKLPISEIIGNKISFFIPSPYDSYLNQLPYYLQLATEAAIKFPDHFFLSLPSKFLIDCTVKGSLVSMHNNLFFLFIFQKINIPQEFAVISSEWDIYSHSENFPQLAQIISKDLRGCNIKHLFPSLATIDIQAFTPLFLADISTYLIYCIIDFYGLKINYVLLINDKIEAETWKTDKRIEKINKEFTPKQKLCCDFSQRKEENVSTNVFKTDFDDKIEPYHNSQIRSQFYKIDRIVSLSSRSINIFHIVFVSAVKNI
ncbi:unnamed protein product [Blepharisma stoltei]|uniref:TmcB/TmcC TPR repeats domain-containing protein n=1 Tax=Blepharisma stoltei TaxID=1481888 RepID=A0AAU9JD82_9CILI|nr:unnamed protein product [Blepharisma stoltei]